MKIRYLIVLGAVALLFSGYKALANARHATNLQNQILARDKQAQDVTADIAALTDYTHNHMNAGVTVFLADSYNRAVAAATPPPPAQPDGQVYAQAQASCSSHADSITQAKCVQNYLTSHAPAPAPAAALPPMPKKADYTYALHSPGWAPDAAGIGLLAGGVLLLLSAWIKLTSRF